MKFYLLISISVFFAACGADLGGKNLEKEKDRNREVSSQLYRSGKEAEKLQEMVKSLRQTATLQWLYVGQFGAVVASSFSDAEKQCNNVGFALPSAEQIEAEGLAIDIIQKLDAYELFDSKLRLKDLAYLQDHHDDTKSPPFRGVYLVCVRPIPAK